MPALTDRRTALFAIGGVILAASFAAARKQPPDRTHIVVPEIDNATALARLAAGALAIDVRDAEFFNEKHLPGALLVPIITLRLAIPAVLADATAQPIIVYCGDGVSSGPEATQILQRHGFKNAMNLTAGLDGWSSDGHPVVRGSDTGSVKGRNKG